MRENYGKKMKLPPQIPRFLKEDAEEAVQTDLKHRMGRFTLNAIKD